MARILANVADNNRLPGFQRRAAQTLGNWKSRIRWWFMVARSDEYEFLLDDLVDPNPPIAPCRADNLRNLLHPLGASARQDKRPDLLQLLTRLGLHSGYLISLGNLRERGQIQIFLIKLSGLIDNNVDKACIGANRAGVKERATIDMVRIPRKDCAAIGRNLICRSGL